MRSTVHTDDSSGMFLVLLDPLASKNLCPKMAGLMRSLVDSASLCALPQDPMAGLCAMLGLLAVLSSLLAHVTDDESEGDELRRWVTCLAVASILVLVISQARKGGRQKVVHCAAQFFGLARSCLRKKEGEREREQHGCHSVLTAFGVAFW